MGSKPAFSMFVDLSEKKAVVIGGQGEAVRRAIALLPCAKEVTVIAQTADQAIRDLAFEGKLKYLSKTYEREDIFGADLVVAASGDPKTDLDAAAACKCLGIPVNVAAAENRGDFFFSPVEIKEDT